MSGASLDLPRITIITPSYNQAATLPATIASVLGQGYPDLEYLVIDGGSTDGTLEILKGYGSSLQWLSEKDHGQAEAINKGLRAASGDVLAFLNSDDVYEPGALLTVGRYFAAHPQAQWLTGRCNILDRSGRIIRPFVSVYKNAWLALNWPAALYVLNFISQPATFWQRRLTAQVGYLDETLYYTLDYEYWLRLQRAARLHVLKDTLAGFRYYASSKSGACHQARFQEQYEVACRYHPSRLTLSLHRLHNRITVFIFQRTAPGGGE